MQSTRKRLPLDLTSETYERLKKLQERTKKTSMAETIREALGIYEYVVSEQEQGNKVYLGKNEKKIQKEMVLPSTFGR